MRRLLVLVLALPLLLAGCSAEEPDTVEACDFARGVSGKAGTFETRALRSDAIDDDALRRAVAQLGDDGEESVVSLPAEQAKVDAVLAACD